MEILRWMTSLFSSRGKALALYRSGMKRAANKDFDGAISDYTRTIQLPGIPSDVKAMATYNRALALYAMELHDQAAADLETLLKMPGLPEDIKTAASQRQERIKRREGREGVDYRPL